MADDPIDDRKIVSPMPILVPTNDDPDRLPGIIEASRLERTQQIKARWLYQETLASVPRNVLLSPSAPSAITFAFSFSINLSSSV